MRPEIQRTLDELEREWLAEEQPPPGGRFHSIRDAGRRSPVQAEVAALRPGCMPDSSDRASR
jgi:hypothetical protein